MSQLMNMRQRIKAVETTKKITHAMRLISMSTHSRLRIKKNILKNYNDHLDAIIQSINIEHCDLTTLHNPNNTKSLAILVGSQKGLCGTFNVNNFKYFEYEVELNINIDIIPVGKYCIDYTKHQNIKPIESFPDFTSNKFISIAQDLSDFIWKNRTNYNSIKIYYNHPQSFFIQKPTTFVIWPSDTNCKNLEKDENSNYTLEDTVENIMLEIQKIKINTMLQKILLDSLLAEQAARFLSMDNSTRNADKLITEMKLNYNKTRQTAITRELTELISGFSID